MTINYNDHKYDTLPVSVTVEKHTWDLLLQEPFLHSDVFEKRKDWAEKIKNAKHSIVYACDIAVTVAYNTEKRDSKEPEIINKDTPKGLYWQEIMTQI